MQMTRTHTSMILKMKKSNKLLGNIIDKLFDWFSNNLLKANPGKCQPAYKY